MNMPSVVAKQIEQPVFKTTCEKITKGASIFLDIGPCKIMGDGKEHLSFRAAKPASYSGAFQRIEPPILVWRIDNPDHFKPKMAGERWKVKVGEIEITSQLTNNKQFQKVLVHISVVERVEKSFSFYDEKTKQYVVETRSGRATVSRVFFPTEEQVTEYHDQQRGEPMVLSLCNVYAQIDGFARELLFQTLVGAVSKSILVREKTSEIVREALLKGRHGNNRDFTAQAKKEVEKYFAGLPQIPKELKSDMKK